MLVIENDGHPVRADRHHARCIDVSVRGIVAAKAQVAKKHGSRGPPGSTRRRV
jgi:hypothetical protein